jgi:hypothetical protein
MRNLLLIIAVAVAGYLAGPQLSARVLPFLGSFRGLNMRLDPGLSDAIDDRRGGGGGLTRTGMPGGEEGGFPDGGDFPGDARGQGGPGGFPGGFPGGSGGLGGGGVRCRDSQTGRDVDMSFCDRQDRELGRRRR